jgi:predicted patatin/cPLA2 family phospholipase
MTENSKENAKSIIESEGKPKEVFQDLLRFKNERKKGEPENGPLFMVLGGGQRGAYGGGGVEALQELGLEGAFKTAVGVSTGSPIISYFLAGLAKIGSSIYSEENTGSEFINLRRGNDGENIMDITWLASIFRSSSKKLDIEKMRSNSADIFYAVTNAETGKGELIDAKKLKDPIEGIRASCAVPELYNDPVYLYVGEKEERYIDGDVAMPFPAEQILSKVTPTSILVFANRPKKRSEGLLDRFAKKYASLVVESQLEQDVLTGTEKFNKNLKFLKEYSEKNNIPYTIVWTDGNVGPLERRPGKLKKAADDFKNYILNIAK